MCMELRSPHLFWVETHASFPGLADRQIASVVFFQTQPRVNAQAARKSKAFTFVSMCSLLTACHAVVHLISCSEALFRSRSL
jgi:hypothetical protein